MPAPSFPTELEKVLDASQNSLMRRAFRYRLWTNANQERELGIMLESHRRLYNQCLERRKTAYEMEKRSVKYTEQSAWFKVERNVNPFFARLNFSSAQDTMRRLDKALQAFFRRVKAGENRVIRALNPGIVSTVSRFRPTAMASAFLTTGCPFSTSARF